MNSVDQENALRYTCRPFRSCILLLKDRTFCYDDNIMKTALLVVDAQKYFLQKAPEGFLRKITEECMGDYALVVFTAFKNTIASNFVQSLGWQACMDENDTALPDALLPFIHKDNVFTRTAYSAFQSTDLHTYLSKNGIEKIVLGGIDTDACVLATAFAAFDYGYRVAVKFDITFSAGNLQDEASRILMRNIVWRLA
jgi:nicotinamidase-related amidase